MDVCQDLEKKDMLLDEGEKAKVAREVMESADGHQTLQQLITAKVKALVSFLYLNICFSFTFTYYFGELFSFYFFGLAEP